MQLIWYGLRKKKSKKKKLHYNTKMNTKIIKKIKNNVW